MGSVAPPEKEKEIEVNCTARWAASCPSSQLHSQLFSFIKNSSREKKKNTLPVRLTADQASAFCENFDLAPKLNTRRPKMTYLPGLYPQLFALLLGQGGNTDSVAFTSQKARRQKLKSICFWHLSCTTICTRDASSHAAVENGKPSTGCSSVRHALSSPHKRTNPLGSSISSAGPCVPRRPKACSTRKRTCERGSAGHAN